MKINTSDFVNTWGFRPRGRGNWSFRIVRRIGSTLTHVVHRQHVTLTEARDELSHNFAHGLISITLLP